MTAGLSASLSGTYIHISLSPGLLPKSRTWDRVAADPAVVEADARKRFESFIVNDPAGWGATSGEQGDLIELLSHVEAAAFQLRSAEPRPYWYICSLYSWDAR